MFDLEFLLELIFVLDLEFLDQWVDLRSMVFFLVNELVFIWSVLSFDFSFFNDLASSSSSTESDESYYLKEERKLDSDYFDFYDLFSKVFCFMKDVRLLPSFDTWSLDNGESGAFLVDLNDLDRKTNVFLLGESLNLEISIVKFCYCLGWTSKLSWVMYLFFLYVDFEIYFCNFYVFPFGLLLTLLELRLALLLCDYLDIFEVLLWFLTSTSFCGLSSFFTSGYSLLVSMTFNSINSDAFFSLLSKFSFLLLVFMVFVSSCKLSFNMLYIFCLSYSSFSVIWLVCIRSFETRFEIPDESRFAVDIFWGVW